MALGISPEAIVEKGNYRLLVKANHWQRIPLSDVATVQNGFAFKSEFFDRERGLPLIRIRDITKSETEHKFNGAYDASFVVRNGNILIGMDGDFTVARWQGEDALLNQRVCRIRVKSDGYDEKFLLIVLQPYLNAIHAETSSVTVKHLSSRTIGEIPLPLPPTQEQHRIVAKIETLFSEMDKGIESLKTAREQLKIFRQALLKHAFEGKLTTEWREQNKDKLVTARQLLTNASQNIGAQLKAPSSWIVYRVEDVLILGPSNGRSVKDRKGGFPVLRLTALKGGKIDLSESKSGDWSRDEAQAYIVKEGDFLLSRGNGSKHLVGRGGVVPKHEDEVAYPDTIVRLRVNPELILIKFFSLLWESRVLRDQIEAASQTTAGIYKINQGHIKAFAVPVPTLTEQQLIVRELEEKMSLIDHQLHDVDLAIAASETLRQSILKKAFSGQLVPQDPNDEPASALLARIQTEKDSLLAKPKTPVKRTTKANSNKAS